MDPSLGANAYGKAEVRVVKVSRAPANNRLRDLTADVTLRGDFDAVHTAGDNAGLPATDTMRNVVYATAAEHPLESLPEFAEALALRLLGMTQSVRSVTVRLREHPWERLNESAWQRGSGGTRVQIVDADHSTVRHSGGIEDLLVLRSSGSAFSGFARDRFTTLPETEDRILATVVAAEWDYAHQPSEEAWTRTREALLSAFTDHDLYGAPVLGYILRRINRLDDAADVLAETFLVAWRRLDQVPDGPQVRILPGRRAELRGVGEYSSRALVFAAAICDVHQGLIGAEDGMSPYLGRCVAFGYAGRRSQGDRIVACWWNLWRAEWLGLQYGVALRG
jgi:urate oxidase